MKKAMFTIALFLASSINTLFAQKVEIEGDKVTLESKEILKYEKINLYQISFYSLETGDEILLFKAFNNETPENTNDDYYILNFLKEKIKIETTDFSKIFVGFGLNAKKNMQKLISWLVKEKVLAADGKINREKLDVFYEKYNENIRQRTIR